VSDFISILKITGDKIYMYEIDIYFNAKIPVFSMVIESQSKHNAIDLAKLQAKNYGFNATIKKIICNKSV